MKCLVEEILIQEPRGDYLLILPPGADDTIGAVGTNTTIITPKLKYYSIEEQIRLPRILREYKIDLLHSPHFVLPIMRECPCVATIHDVIGIACKDDLGSTAGRMYYRAMISAAVRIAEQVIAVSKFSRDEIVRYLGIDHQKIKVIYEGIGSDFKRVCDGGELEKVRRKYRIENDYILYAGIYKPRKNHAGLFKAYRIFLESNPHSNLVIVGPMGDGQNELSRLAESLGIRDEIIFTGVVDDEELRSIYSAARVYACPSLYEGFGFTVLEAMACETPVVCSRDTSLPEVAGEAALFADPRVPEEFAAALHLAFTDAQVRSALIEIGKQNLQRFSWANAARDTLDVYRNAIQVSTRKSSVRLRTAASNPDKPVHSD